MNPSEKFLQDEKRRIQLEIAKADASLSARERALNEKASRLRQNQVKNMGSMDLETNLRNNLPKGLVPGNVGDINRVIWPFYFTTTPGTIGPNGALVTSISISQEAGFIMTHFSKVVYKEAPAGTYTYVDPDTNTGAGEAPGLRMAFRNNQSQMTFVNVPMNVDHVGNPRWPTKMDSPLYLFPNSIFSVLFTNNDPAAIYVPSVAFFGYRLRSEESMRALSPVYG
jgi:hypothetical protein